MRIRYPRFRGRNAKKGALGEFLQPVRSSEIASGSVLAVETLNRLSRQEPLEAFDQLRELLKAGIEIWTLHDGQRYTRDKMREIGPLIIALVHMATAHQETRAIRCVGEVCACWRNAASRIRVGARASDQPVRLSAYRCRHCALKPYRCKAEPKPATSFRRARKR